MRFYGRSLCISERMTDLSFLDFDGTKRHPGGTRAVADSKQTKPLA